MATAAAVQSTAGSKSLAVPEGRPRAVSWEDDQGTDGPPKPVPMLSTPGKEKDKKIGHRRVDEAGQVTYKRKTTSELMAAIQLGIGQSVGRLAPKARRDVLYADFHMVETVLYPSHGGPQTPAHHHSDFSFKAYAPIAFQYFRELFGIQTDDYLISLCNEPLRELSNPGASGSIFYITNDDEFIIKTVKHIEADFLQKLLPGYYMNLNQNRATLLPKFYGLYCYQCGGKNIRFVVMNNLLPSSVRLHAKFDLKGSTYKRLASSRERMKSSPTYKDLDFNEIYPEGILLEADTREALKKTIERDCRVLQSFKIMDYSFLLAVHNQDLAKKEAAAMQSFMSVASVSSEPADGDISHGPLTRTRSMHQRVAQYSTAVESIQASDFVDYDDSSDIPSGGIPARSTRGESLVLFIGIIDVLQSYRLAKKFEHTFKAMVTDGDSISVHRPGFYAQRFQNYISEIVFRKMTIALRHSPSKRKSFAERQKSLAETTLNETETNELQDGETSAIGGRPDVLPTSGTPIPPYTSQLDMTAIDDNQPSVSVIGPVQNPVPLGAEKPDSSSTNIDLMPPRKILEFSGDDELTRTAVASATVQPDAVIDANDIHLAVKPDAASSEVSVKRSSSDNTSTGYLASGSGDAGDWPSSSSRQT